MSTQLSQIHPQSKSTHYSKGIILSLVMLAGGLIQGLDVEQLSSFQPFTPQTAHAQPPKKGKAKVKAKAQGASKAQPAPVPEGPECKSLLLMEPDTEAVIQEFNADEPLYPASMTKLMLSYVVLKRLHEGGLKESDMVTVSARASKIGGSQVYLKEGEQFSIKELLQAVMIQSANDASTAIAEFVAGSPEGFVEIMNQEAQNLGLHHATFTSPHGLPPSTGQEPDRVSARDMAVLGKALVKNYPEILELTKLSEADFRGGEFHMSNHNHLLRNFPGCDGLKTGFYNEAGFNVTATAVRNGVRMIAVAMGCRTRKGRDSEVAKMLSTGLAQYRPVLVASADKPVDKAIPVSGAAIDSIAAYPEADLKVTVRAGEEKKIEKRVELCQGLQAPVQPKAPCGHLVAVLGGREVGRVGLVVNETIAAVGRMGRMRARLGF